jgi:glutamate-ammonia-ligase adenylyltransferase
MKRLLERVRFRNPARAAAGLSRLADSLSLGVQNGLRSLLSSSPDPDSALNMLVRMREERPEAFDRLASSVAGLTFMVSVFSFSRFLSEDVLRHPEWLEELAGSSDMDRVLSVEDYEEKLDALLDELQFLDPDASEEPSPATLALFRRRQLLRILLRDVQGFCTLPEITEELSNLADAILGVVCRRLRAELAVRYGEPRACESSAGVSPALVVFSLGKLGGRELNYSSDIDLMFVYSGSGETDGPSPIANQEFFRKLAGKCVERLSAYTGEGRCYRVDLRLRPEGSLGEIALSLEAAENYYEKRARDWELQMLIKARVSAGDAHLGQRLLAAVEPRIYTTTLDFSAVESMSATRLRLSEKLAAKSGPNAGFDVKLMRGGIRDIEFLVQCLQRLHGGREPWVRHGGSMLALFRLRDKGLLSDNEYSQLASAYQFLRNLEHRLQFDEDRQTHTLPTEPAELDLLARKMPPGEMGGALTGEALLGQVNRHLEEVQEIYARVVHAQQPMYYSQGLSGGAGEQAAGTDNTALAFDTGHSNVLRSLDQRAPGLAGLLAHSDLQRGQKHFEHFLESIFTRTELLSWLDEDPELSRRALDLFEHSPFFSEQLIRSPELLGELRGLKPAEPALSAAEFESIEELRSFFQWRMFQIQTRSICWSAPIFRTLEETSDLADTVIRAAYSIAARQLAGQSGGTAPAHQMMVVSLGRLGMREFDLGSDADLLFVLPDSEVKDLPFWTRVAERAIELITSYTGHGVMFAVDTRLRPNGREGGLVQTESAYREYFERGAEAWEGIAYMKARAVAGSIKRATKFLQTLQDVDWRRYGQSGRSKSQLVQMRARIEKELAAVSPLKAGRGGYFDIDFALMYLRLKGAGIFFKVLNTPARIDAIERMGHLEKTDANFLNDAATFYRAVDHGLRVSTGHSEGGLPVSPAQLENLAALVRRWTPEHLHDEPLDVELAQIQSRTRAYFNKLFEVQPGTAPSGPCPP